MEVDAMIRDPATLQASLRRIERFDRDVRLFRLYERTSQIQQLVIARNLIAPRRRGPENA